MPYNGKQSGLTEPAGSLAAVTPSDDTDMTYWAVALYVGTAGHVKLTCWGGDTATFKNVAAGSVLPVRCRRVYATGTTASDIVGLF